MSHTYFSATTVADLAKGDAIEVRSTRRNDVDVITGTFVSVNSKGINVKVIDKVVTRSLATVTHINRVSVVDDTPDVPADLFVDGVVYTAAAVAAALDMSAYDLRVQLRNLGMGVGKGRKYGMDAGDARNVYAAIKTVPSNA